MALEARLDGRPCPSILLMTNQTNAPFHNVTFLSKIGQTRLSKARVTVP